MHTTQRVIIYIIIMLACLILYKYGKSIFEQHSQELLEQQRQQLLLEQKQEEEKAATASMIAQQEAEKQMFLEKKYNVFSDDIDNLSLDFSADNISKRSITESLSSHKLESFLGETN